VGRQSWCSQSCIDQHKIKTQPGYVARLVEARDHGVLLLMWARLYRDLIGARGPQDEGRH